jgi:hypothetical protein
MTSRWLVWEEEQEDFERWSGDRAAPLLLLRDDGTEIVAGAPIHALDQVRLLVINGNRATSCPQHAIEGIDAWIAGAKAWIHIGGVDGSPDDRTWTAFGRGASSRAWPALSQLAPTARKAFGSTHNKVVFFDIAPLTKATLTGAPAATVLDALEHAWTAGNEATLAEREFESLQQMFPIYLLLTHPEAAAASQALRAAVEDAATPELPESAVSLLRALTPEATGWPGPAAVDAFVAHFRKLAIEVGLQLETAQTLRLSARGET